MEIKLCRFLRISIRTDPVLQAHAQKIHGRAVTQFRGSPKEFHGPAGAFRHTVSIEIHGAKAAHGLRISFVCRPFIQFGGLFQILHHILAYFMELGKLYHGRNMSLVRRLLEKDGCPLPVGTGTDPLLINDAQLIQRIRMSGAGCHGEASECFPFVLRRSLPLEEALSQKIQGAGESGLRRLLKLEKSLVLVLLHTFSI